MFGENLGRVNLPTVIQLHLNYNTLRKVGVLRNTDLKLELIQNSDFFCMIDAIDDVVALAWETEESEGQKRMVFRFGSTEQEIKDKLYERDLILEFEKKLVYES
jgi:hypothetical protein